MCACMYVFVLLNIVRLRTSMTWTLVLIGCELGVLRWRFQVRRRWLTDAELHQRDTGGMTRCTRSWRTQHTYDQWLTGKNNNNLRLLLLYSFFFFFFKLWNKYRVRVQRKLGHLNLMRCCYLRISITVQI